MKLDIHNTYTKNNIMDIKAKNELYNEVEALTQKIETLKETIKSQGDQLVIFHAKEEKPETND